VRSWWGSSRGEALILSARAEKKAIAMELIERFRSNAGNAQETDLRS